MILNESIKKNSQKVKERMSQNLFKGENALAKMRYRKEAKGRI